MYKLGDKVVPHDKSRGCNLKHSREWEKAKSNYQEFLYVTCIDDDNDIWCAYKNHDVQSEVFIEEDLTPYIEEKIEGKVLFQENMGVKYTELKVKDLIDLVDKGIVKETDVIIVGRK
jgi:muramoyltetrapeptide carboxypeptidase LdcA involved in peptidoglycan recycling